MMFVWTAMTGWFAIVLLVAGISIPYLIRARRSGKAIPVNLKAHYGLGMLIPAAAFVHAMVPMSAGRVGAYDSTGLMLATCALIALLWQAGLGLVLRASRGGDRINSRRLHFGTMLLIAALVAAHVVMNSPGGG